MSRVGKYPVAIPSGVTVTMAGKVVTVVEFYREPEMVQHTVADISHIIWIAAGLSGLILFAAIVLAVAFGSRRMKAN